MTIHYRLPGYPIYAQTLPFNRIPVLRRRQLEKFHNYCCSTRQVDRKTEDRTIPHTIGNARFPAISNDRRDGNKKQVKQDCTIKSRYLVHGPVTITGLLPLRTKTRQDLKSSVCLETYQPKVCYRDASEIAIKVTRQQSKGKYVLKKANQNSDKRVQKSEKYYLSKTLGSKSKTKETKDRFEVGSANYSSALMVSHSRAKKNLCETRIVPNEQEVSERLFATKNGILRLSCEKRRILIGEILPAVNEINYLACPAGRSQGIRKIKKKENRSETVSPLPGITPPPSTPSAFKTLILENIDT